MPRRQLGRYLRDLRNSQRLTVRTAAERLEWSEAKMWRIETGQVSLRSLDVEVMCRIYGASAELTEALMGLARETKARGWWHAYGDVIPEGFDLYIGLEEAASSLAWYESELIPGLLQTGAYAHTLMWMASSCPFIPVTTLVVVDPAPFLSTVATVSAAMVAIVGGAVAVGGACAAAACAPASPRQAAPLLAMARVGDQPPRRHARPFYHYHTNCRDRHYGADPVNATFIMENLMNGPFSRLEWQRPVT